METMTYAQACGEEPFSPLSFIPGEDFDPSDEFEVEAVGLAMERDMEERHRVEINRLRDENYRLHLRLAMVENNMTQEEAIEHYHKNN